MHKITLYHGTADKIVTSTFGLGNDRHDYGNVFYLTDDIELAKEWAVCRPNEKNGCVHTYTLDINNLNIFDFQKVDILTWLAE